MAYYVENENGEKLAISINLTHDSGDPGISGATKIKQTMQIRLKRHLFPSIDISTARREPFIRFASMNRFKCFSYRFGFFFVI